MGDFLADMNNIKGALLGVAIGLAVVAILHCLGVSI